MLQIGPIRHGRGPALGGVNLRKTIDLSTVSDTRSCTAFGAAVRPVHASDDAFPRHHQGRGNAQGAVSKAHRAGSGGVHNHQHFGIWRWRASVRGAKKRWSDSSLQVKDPKASGTPTSLANTCVTFSGSATTMAAHSIMVCALCQRRSLASDQACSSDLPSSCEYSE